MMNRAGAQAPLPPCLSPTPSAPTKPPFHRDNDLQEKERFLPTGRARNQLREKVVQLARRKEGNGYPDVSFGSVNSVSTSVGQGYGLPCTVTGANERPRKEVTFLLNDDKHNKGTRSRMRGGNVIHTGSEQVTLTDLAQRDGGLLSESHHTDIIHAPHSPQEFSSTQQHRPVPPDAPPLPRSARLRSRQGHGDETQDLSLEKSPYMQTILLPGCPSLGAKDTPFRNQHHQHHHHHHHEEHLHHTDRVMAARLGLKHHLTQYSSWSANDPHAESAATGASTATRTLRAPSQIALTQTTQHEHGSQKTKSAHSHTTSSAQSSGWSRDIKQKDTAMDTHLSSQPFPFANPTKSARQSDQGQEFDYKKAARVLNQANINQASARHTHSRGFHQHPPPNGKMPHPPATDAAEPKKRLRVIYVDQTARAGGPKTKSLKARTEKCSSHHQSSASPGDRPRQTSRGSGDKVGVEEMRGSALPSSPQRLHTPISHRRHDNRNPSSFTSSLEMFKRRLRMNSNRLTKDIVEEYEEDYVIWPLEAVPSTPAPGNCKPQNGSLFGNHASIVPYGKKDISFDDSRKQPSKERSTAYQPDQSDQIDRDNVSIRRIPHPPKEHGRQSRNPPSPHSHGDESYRRKPSSPHPSKMASRKLQSPSLSAAKEQGEEKMQDRWTMAGDWETQSREEEKGLRERPSCDGQEEEEQAVAKESKEEVPDIEINSSASNTKGPESGIDFSFGHVAEVERTPLPQVRTYVVEGSDASRRLPGHGLESMGPRPLALTQHNVSMHNTFLQRRLERERTRQRRAELEKKAGMHGGGVKARWNGPDNIPDEDARMQRWLVDTEYQQQKEFQPVIANFKIAVMPTA